MSDLGRPTPSLRLGRRGALRAGAGGGQKWPGATIWPAANFHTINARQFAEEVKKATSGAVEIDVKAGGELSFTGPEQLRARRDVLGPQAGILDSQQVGDHPNMGVEGLPFLCASTDELKVLHKHLRPEFEKVALKNNQTILYMVPWPAQYLHLTIKAQLVDDLKAVKIRVPDTNARDMCNAIGMAPALIPWGETIAALSSGAVSRASTSAVSGVDGKFWEFLKFFHATNHAWSSQLVTINNDSWKKISPTNRKAIVDLAAKLEPTFWGRSLQADKDSVRKLRDAGMQMVVVPEPMMAGLRKRTAPMV